MRRSTLIASLLLALAGTASATVIHVPGEYGSIQAAIDNSKAGDVIQIGKDVWVEQVVIADKSRLMLKGKGTIGALGLDHCLVITDSDKIEINGLEFKDAGFGSIVVENSDDVTFDKVHVHDMPGDGIKALGCERLRIERSVFEALGGSGVIVARHPISEKDSSDCVIEKSRIEDIGKDGVDLAGPGHEVSRTQVRNIGASAFVVRADADGGLVSKCRIEDCGAFGVLLAGSGNEVVKSKVYDVELDGVLVEGHTNTLTKLKIVNCGGDGVEVRKASSNVVEKSKIVDIGGNGIEIDGEGNRFLKNKVADVSGNGIQVAGTGSHLEKNTVKDVTGHGLAMLQAGGNTAVKNKIRLTDGLDIYEEPDLAVPNVYEGNRYKTSNLPDAT